MQIRFLRACDNKALLLACCLGLSGLAGSAFAQQPEPSDRTGAGPTPSANGSSETSPPAVEAPSAAPGDAGQPPSSAPPAAPQAPSSASPAAPAARSSTPPAGSAAAPDAPGASTSGDAGAPPSSASPSSADAERAGGANRLDLERAREDLARARAQLEQAAREVARLSAEVSAPVVDEIRRRWSTAPRQRAMLGIAIENDDRGARVIGVTPGGPADDAGLEIGDIILSIDGATLTGTTERSPARELVARLGDVDPGDEVQLRIERDGEPRDVTVEARESEPFAIVFGRPFEARELGEAREPGEPREPREARERPDRFPAFVRPFVQPFFGRWRDMELVSLTPELGDYFGTREGLLVVRAPSDGTLPLRDGDVILAIGDRKPSDPEHAMRILGSFEPGETLRLTVMRHGQQQTLQVDLPRDGEAAANDWGANDRGVYIIRP